MRRLSERQGREDPNLLLGIDAPDDAAVYRISEEMALVQTVDFFTPIVDDPYDWGLIAAANAFSDVYAMGGRPLLAMNLVGWPMDLDMDLLSRLLEGGADKAAEAGALIVGGHTIDDREPKYGMAVTGVVHPERVVTSSGGSPGMVLVITKPLSSGIASTALKRGKASPKLVEEVTRLMSTLNREASEAMVETGAGAATDVTGFGLLGHLHQMAKLSGVSVELDWSQVPLLDGVVELAEEGLVPGGTRRNEDYFSQWVGFKDSVPNAIRTILFDAQTSGGLLIALEASRVNALLEALESRGVPAISIGTLVDGEPGRISVT